MNEGNNSKSSPQSTSTVFLEGNPLEVREPQPPTGHTRGGAPASLANMLVEAGILSADQVAKLQEAARRERLSLARILVRDGLIQSRDLATLIALYLGLTMVDLRSESLDPQAASMVPEELARKHVVMAIKQRDGHLTVAMTDPTDLQLIQDLAARTGSIIDPVIATSEDILVKAARTCW